MRKQWLDPQPVHIPEALQSLGLHALILEQLARLGITDPDQAQQFLDADLYQPALPQELPDMEQAVKRIQAAINQQQQILVWGDFDVDGQTATALLVSALQDLGADVKFYIPDRHTEGHGIPAGRLRELLDGGAELVLTCDTGIAAHEAVEYAQGRGVDVIITDHHQLAETLPPAYAAVNPQRLPAGHPLRTLPGVGVAYKLVEALYSEAGRAEKLEAFLDLVALGIVADVAEQVGDTRYLLQCGLVALRKTTRLGLLAIMDLAQIDRTRLDEEAIGFQLGPRLNALGRLDDANIAVELLTTHDNEKARILASRVEGLNEQRKADTNQVFQAAEAMIEQDPRLLNFAVLILGHETWPGGIIGIVANRLVEQYNRPVILFRIEDRIARGSARSVPGCDITEAISQHADLLLTYGGHTMAAGLSLRAEDLDMLRHQLSRTVMSMLGDFSPEATLAITAYIPLDQINDDLLNAQSQLKPFGPGNPPLMLATPKLSLTNIRQIGRSEQHRRLTVTDEYNTSRDVVWWNAEPDDLPPGRFDMAYTVSENVYRDKHEIQITLVDFRPVDEEPQTFAHRREIEILDYRSLPLKAQQSHLQELSGDAVIWAEGKSLDSTKDTGRDMLRPGHTLVIWSAPPAMRDLQGALEIVNPARVVLFGVLPGTDSVQGFLERFSGAVKHVLASKQGKTTLPTLCGVMAHSPTTIRAALDWMVTRGHIRLQTDDGDTLLMAAGGEQNRGAFAATTARLSQQLQEAAAFRAHFQRADARTLIQPI